MCASLRVRSAQALTATLQTADTTLYVSEPVVQVSTVDKLVSCL